MNENGLFWDNCWPTIPVSDDVLLDARTSLEEVRGSGSVRTVPPGTSDRNCRA